MPNAQRRYLSRENAELAQELTEDIAKRVGHVPEEHRPDTLDRVWALHQRKIVCRATF